VPNLPAARPINARGPRQPPPAIALDIYRRDGFRCRYCGCRIVAPQAQNIIAALLPGAVSWGSRDIELNAAFYTLKGVLDHVVPHANGGTSDPENIVVSCQPCNYGKGNYFLEQLGLLDPRLRNPIVDDWDGLLRVLPLRPPASRHPPKRIVSPKPRVSIDDFAASFSEADRRHLETLLQTIASCADLGVFWTLEQVLLVKLPAPAATIAALGIERGATVQIPWSVGPYKQEFRSFAETLAAAMPGGSPYEREKMWRVSCFGRTPRLSDLIHDPNALRDAFLALHRQLSQAAAPPRP
jgi:5-methylcytosine-specific restriction endonuclease McrA